MITIAIPFYNAEKYLDLAIRSVLAQTYTNWKLILIDDGSNDRSLEIANNYKETDSRIRVYSDGKNKNLGHRLNEITRLTDTRYLARMDADDIMHPNRIEIQLKILENNPEIDVLGSNAYSIDENNNVTGIRLNTDLDSPKLIDCKSFIHPSVIAKTSWLLKNPYDTEAFRVEDHELWSRTLHESIFKVYTGPLLFYREFGGNYYKKYLGGVKSLFRIARKRKTFSDYYFAIIFCLKTCLYYIFNLLDLEYILVRNRSYKITPKQIKVAKEIINSITKG